MIRLHTLGSIRLEDTDGRDCGVVLRQSKRLALLIYLARRSRRGPVRRDTLLGVFWPEAPLEHARNSLSQAVHFLRQHLGEGVVVSQGEQVSVGAERLWCDALAFETAIEQGSPETAMELYQGEFLEGFFLSNMPEFEQWLEEERQGFRTQASDACWSVAEEHAAQAQQAQAASWARRAAAATPLDEVQQRRLLTVLASVGDKAGAIAAFEEFSTRLQEAYGTSPAPETYEIVNRLRASASTSPASAPAAGLPARDPSSAIPSAPPSGDRATVAPTAPKHPEWPGPKRAFVIGTLFAVVLIAIGGAIWTTVRVSDDAAAVVQRQLTSEGNVLFAALSPDGRRVAYTTGSWGQVTDLWVQELDSGRPSLLLREAILEVTGWYGDNKTLLLLVKPDTSGPRWMTISSGGLPQPVAPRPRGFFRASPDGSRRAEFLLNYEILTVDDSIQLRIPEAPDWVGEAEWSHDGRKLAVLTGRAGRMTIWTTPADSAQWTEVVTTEDLLQSPRWSPDGSALYFFEREHGAWSIRKISLTEAADTAVVLVTDLHLQSEDAPYNLWFTTSRDATTLAYVRELRRTNLWAMDSSGPRQLTTDQDRRSDLTLSPDGTQLAYVRQSATGWDIYTMPVSGGPEVRVTFSDREKWSPAWSPNQSEIAFGAVLEDGGGKLWIVDVATGEERAYEETQLEWAMWTSVYWGPSDWVLYWVRYTNLHLFDPGTDRMRPAPLFRDPRFMLGKVAIDPSGQYVAAAKQLGEEFRYDLTVTAIRDGVERLVATDSTQWFPIGWSGDGSWIYVRDSDWGHRMGGRRVAAVHATDGQIRPIFTLPDLPIDHAVITPDGKQVFYIPLEAESDVWLVEGFDPAAVPTTY